MSTTNGDAQGFFQGEIQDYTKALEILEKQYPTRDGLDVDTLLDSDKHGALTYNDFLILPGYIGMAWMILLSNDQTFTDRSIRIPRFRRHP